MTRALLPSLLAACLACATTSGARREDVASARRQLARTLLDRGEPSAAREAVDPLCHGRRPDPEALGLRGVAHQRLGLEREAEEDLREALKLDGRLAFAHSALGILLDLSGRGAEAEEHHRRAVTLAPRDARYLNNLGFSLFARGRPRDAVPVFLEALRQDARDVRARNNLGFAYAAGGDFARARQEFERAGDPRQAVANLALAYERRGSLAQAYDLYVELGRLAPDDAEARAGVARVAHARGLEGPAAAAGASGAARGGGL
ncbi:MAG TPA: tetratricopeptide repeat protein [Anaeromyxobacter sp.]